jgi:hypothetical protein
MVDDQPAQPGEFSDEGQVLFPRVARELLLAHAVPPGQEHDDLDHVVPPSFLLDPLISAY